MNEVNEKVIDWIDKADHDLGSANGISQDFRDFAIKTIGIKE